MMNSDPHAGLAGSYVLNAEGVRVLIERTGDPLGLAEPTPESAPEPPPAPKPAKSAPPIHPEG